MKLDFKQEFQRFNDHLNFPDNDRIIFSAPFGIGKTTFLNDFFESRDDYEVFHLFPANYSVSENDNIFEYIKYDILYQLIEKTDLEQEKFNYTQTLQSFITNYGDKLVNPFIEALSVLNKEGSTILKTLYSYLKLGNEYLKYHKEIQKGDLETIEEFRKDFESKVGSIYEQNFITQLIQYYLAKISEPTYNESVKQTVLVIDDLDRIDPDHFFRILNIFAAHIDQNKSENGLRNKFGFDKVIFVFDKENARNIFHYRYGPKVDYNGYINKFYSRTIFEFDPFPDIQTKLNDILNGIQFCGSNKDLFNFRDNSSLYRGFIIHIIIAMLNTKQINLRNLLKLLDKEYIFQTRKLNLPGIKHSKNTDFVIITVFDLLTEILGEPKGLETALQENAKFSDFRSDYHTKFYILQHLIALLDYKAHHFSGRREAFIYKVNGHEFAYQLINSPNVIWAKLNDEEVDDVDPISLKNKISSININTLIYSTFMICKDLGIYI